MKTKEMLLPLLDLAFGWPFRPTSFEDLIKIDPRSKDGPVGFCAMENGRLIGFVGVLNLATRALDGTTEYAAGIYGVATLPSHTRKGVSTALLNRAHEYSRERGYRFSFLATSRTIVAHSLYQKLGYIDLLERPSAYKVTGRKKYRPKPKRDVTRFDLDRILKIYIERMKGKTGLVLRDEAYFRMLKKAEGLTAKQCIMDKEGYVLFRRDTAGIWIRELVALDAMRMDDLIAAVESRTKDLVYDRSVLDDELLQVYESRGYMVQRQSHTVMMFKPLSKKASFSQTYGDKFYVSGLDFF